MVRIVLRGVPEVRLARDRRLQLRPSAEQIIHAVQDDRRRPDIAAGHLRDLVVLVVDVAVPRERILGNSHPTADVVGVLQRIHQAFPRQPLLRRGAAQLVVGKTEPARPRPARAANEQSQVSQSSMSTGQHRAAWAKSMDNPHGPAGNET